MEKTIGDGRTLALDLLTFGVVEREVLGKRDAEMKQKLLDIKTQAKSKREMLGMSAMQPDMSSRMKPSDVSEIRDGRLRLAASTSMIKDPGNISATRDNTPRLGDGPSMMKDVSARPDDSIFFARKKELETSRDILNRTQMQLDNLKNRKPVQQPNMFQDPVKGTALPNFGKFTENKAPKEDPVYSFEPPAPKGLKYFDEDSTPVKAGPKVPWQGDQPAMNPTRSQSGIRSVRRIPQPVPKEDDELEKFVRAAQEENNKLKQDNQNLAKRYQNLQDAADATYKNQKQIVPYGGFMGAQPPVIQKVNKPPTVEQLLANNTRNWDLNDFERALAFIEAQEHDELDMIAELPVGTDAYRFKVERFKEISTTRAEIQKLMQEQQLKAMKKGLDLQSRLAEVRSDNIAWTNEQRKNIIQAHMRRQLGLGNQLEYNDPNPKQPSKTKKPKKKKGEYDPAEGFVIHWDYVLGIPAKQDFANYEFAVVCKSEVLRDTKEGEMVPNIQEDSKSVYSIFAQNNVIKGLEPDPETLIIWKVFMPVSEEKPNEYTEVGWTQIDPFSDAGKLQRGVWKCPLYELPVDPNITREDVQRLKLNPIGDPWFHVRISFPAKDDYASLGVKPEETAHLAEIPNIHLRMKSWMPRADPLPPKEPEPLPIPEPTIIREPEPPKPVEPPPPVVPDINPNDRVGCIIDMKRVIDYPKNNKVMKVAMICLEQGVPIEDDTTLRWVRNTIQHHPFIGSGAEALDDGTGTGAGNFRDDQLVKEGKMANLSKGDSLVVYNNTKFNLYKNFPRVWAENRKHYWLVFQLLEKRIETGAEIAKYLDPNMAEDERAEAERKVNPFVTVGYAVFRLSTNDFKLREGLHTVNWLKPPVKIPPFEESQIPRIDSRAQLEFKILRSFYDKKDIEREYLAYKKSGKKKQDDGLANVIDPSKLDVNISNEPFIPNKKKQFQDKLFEKGYGVDFYLDQCMFMPDNVSIVKCVIRVVNARYKDVFELKAALPKLNIPNDGLNPIFEYRTEYRAENFNPTSLILITLITIDKAHNEPRVIGYAAINLFVNRYTEEQPIAESDSDIVLQNGNYQIPIYAEEPLRVQPFDLSRIQKLKILPCASVLVRIRLAPLGPDFTVLSRATTRKEDWKRLGVWVPRPEYPTGVYNTQYMEIKDDERRLFPFRDSRAEQPVTEEARLLLKVAGENREFDEIQLYKWLDSRLVINKNTKLLDTKYFARYLEQAGFKFTVDAVHNVPNTNPYVVTFHLNPPGTYYQQIVIPDPKPEEIDTEEKKLAYEQMKATLVQKQKELEATRSDMLVFNAEINWKHPIGQIMYNDNLNYFKDVQFDPYLHIIVEVKELKYQSDDTFKFSDFGWTIVPVFIGDGFVMNGHYQMPLFAGAYPADIFLEELRDRKAWDYIDELMALKKKSPIKYKDNSSVMIRLIDGQREGQFQTKLDINTLDFKFLPQDLELKTRFAFNQQVEVNLSRNKKLQTTIPNNGDAASTNRKIRTACLNQFKITVYN